jgi:hypothetical protein
MKKILAMLALVVVGLGMSGYCRADHIDMNQQSDKGWVVVQRTVDYTNLAFGDTPMLITYTKDMNASPPICYFNNQVVVPCENLKYYFGDK